MSDEPMGLASWSDAKLDKELSFAQGAGDASAEGQRWLAALEAEMARRVERETTDESDEPEEDDDYGNNFGYRCPRCKRGDELCIDATIDVTVHLESDGIDWDVDDGPDWDRGSYACCNNCDWDGEVAQLEKDDDEPD